MHLEIKDGRADELATQLSELTGESIDSAVTRALEERLERERKLRGVAAPEGKHPSAEEQRSVKEKVAKIMAMVRTAGGAHGATSDHSDLYDERGLPR
jgi:antitoxin VapB